MATPFSSASIWNGKPAPSTYLHKQLDVTRWKALRHPKSESYGLAGFTWAQISLGSNQLDENDFAHVESETSLLFGADLGFHEEWLRDEP